ncbi:hypothetical protein ACFQFH_15055 [Halobaculum halobium]|uniref:3-keto-disaccharide hydrolase domain-containing protein n=1 Tax=Halobaculum halobium TaxID=3032281 RepID=A0ABD5TCM3_9EURY|nr:hypothetical protein [Halobaculum sp. SYNS20]
MEYHDDFTWTDPSESEFSWNPRLGDGSKITPHPSEGFVEFKNSKTDEQAYLEMEENVIDLDKNPDVRFTVVESASQPQMGGAWEFFIISQDSAGHRPWVLIDAGGGMGVENTELKDDSSGDGFFARKDQILSHWRDDVGNPMFSWDKFKSAPIDHSEKRELRLELRSSTGEVRGYVDGELQADLSKENGQNFPSKGKVAVMMKLHDRGDHSERGFVHSATLEIIN